MSSDKSVIFLLAAVAMEETKKTYARRIYQFKNWKGKIRNEWKERIEQKEYLHTLKDSTEQLAHITIVQPIGMLTLLFECLVASLGKTEYLVSQLCPCRFCNDKIFHSPIVVFFILFYFLCFITGFCLQNYSVLIILQSTREQQSDIGNLKEKVSFPAIDTHYIVKKTAYLCKEHISIITLLY